MIIRYLRRVEPHRSAGFSHASILEAGDMHEVLEHAQSGGAPSLFILDLLFPGQSAQAIGALCQQFQRSSIVIVSMVDNHELIDEVMAARRQRLSRMCM